MSLWNCPQCGTLTGPEGGPCPRCANPLELFTGEFSVPLLKQQSDFRAHTCGECAWVTKGVLPYCRRVSWNCIPTRNDVQYSGHGLLDPKEPACPAYIPREVQP